MKHFKLTEYTHPADIFKHQENLRANREWAEKEETMPLPKYQPTKVQSLSAGVYNMVRQFLP